MMQVCSCGRDSTATCVGCGTRVCDGCSDPYPPSSLFDMDKENTRATAKDFGPPFTITSARENRAARDGWDGDGYAIVCRSCRISAAAAAVRSLGETPIPAEFGSLGEATSDIIEGRWTPRADHDRPATAQEIDDAIRWHMNNRAGEDVHDSWRSEYSKGLYSPGGFRAVDIEYRKGWTIGSTPDRCRQRGFEGEVFTDCSAVIVDQDRQFHLCNPGSSYSGLCAYGRSGRWFDRREYSRWSPRPPTLLLGDLAKGVVGRHSGFLLKSTSYGDAGLVGVPDFKGWWYQPLQQQ